jgi:hypothetical protein
MTPCTQAVYEPSCPDGSRAKFVLLCCKVLLLVVICLLGGYAPAQQHSEYEVKAAYLYQFGRFIRWPASAPSRFSICVLGHDPFGSLLDSTVAGERIEGKQLSVQRISTLEQASNCRIVFISSSEQHRLSSVLASLSGKPVLTVSDIRDFCDRGGMIQFVLDGGRVRFQVNRTAADGAGVAFSSDLLRVAKLVKGE